MATEADAAKAASDSDATSADGEQDSEAAKEPTQAELREQLDKTQNENRRLKGNLRTVQAQVGQLDSFEARVNKGIGDRMDVILDQELSAEAKRAKLAEISVDSAAESAVESLITRTQPRLDKLVEDSGFQWEGSEFSEVKKAWDARDPATAIDLANQVVTERKLAGTLTEDQVAEVVKTQLKNANLAAANTVVDTEESGGGGGGEGIPAFTSVAEAKTWMRTNPTTKEQRAQIIGRLSGGG